MSELEHLLDEDDTPLTISTQPPPYPPPSGTMILYDRAQTRNYKDDGYDWIKKRNSPKVREDHVKLRVGGRYRVAGCYVHSSTNDTFHRRTYHLLDPETGAALYPPNASSASSVAALLSQTGAASSASVVSHDASVASAPTSGGGRPRKPGGRSLVLVHYLDTDMAALHRAGSEDSSASGSGGTDGTGASSTVSRGSSVRSRSGSKRKKRSARALTGGRGSSTADVMAAVAGSAQAQAAIQVQAAQVAQFQQQQALTQMLRSSLRSTGQPGAAGGGIGDGMGGGIGALAASGMTAQQIHQLATAQQQLQQQQQPVMQGLVGSAEGSVGMGGVNQSAAAAAAAAAAQQAALVQAAATAGLTFPLPGINAQAPGPMMGAQPFAAAPAAVALPSNVDSSSSVVSATPTPPLDGAATARAAAAADLRNEDQLHKLQCRLHSEGSPSLNAAGLPYGASPPLGDSPGAPAAAAAGRPMNRPASSAPMDDDTLDILWDMVMEEGNDSGGKTGTGRLKRGDSSNLETAADLAELFENDDKLGDMLEDAEGMLLADLGSSDGTSDDFDAALADDAIAAVLAKDHKKSAADEDASRFARGKPSRADEEQEMAAIAASAVSAFEQELRDARRAESAGSVGVASANATPEKVAPEQAPVAPMPAVSNSYPSLQAQLSALQQTQAQLQVQQREAERQIQSAQHQQLEAQLQQRGTLQASQLAQATDSLADQMSGAMAPGPKAPYRGQSVAAISEGKVGEPLPDLVDFTPEMADLPVPADQPPKVMLSTSAPLPAVPSAETNIFHWHSLAAYVSASVNAANASVLDIHKLDLSLVKQINPYTFRSSVPVTAMTPGERRIIVVAVQLYAGTDPICGGVAAGVAAALQQAWTIAVGSNCSGGVPPTQVTKPTFTNSTELSSGQIKLLTQFSDDLFTFRGPV